jgi:hypothetical protein
VSELRPYQDNATAEINRVVADGKRRVLLVAPTGSGKTLIFTALIKQYVAAGKRVVVIAHSREIITQTSLKLSTHDIEHGIILAGLAVQLEHPVQVCSIQTLWARAMRTDKCRRRRSCSHQTADDVREPLPLARGQWTRSTRNVLDEAAFLGRQAVPAVKSEPNVGGIVAVVAIFTPIGTSMRDRGDPIGQPVVIYTG